MNREDIGGWDEDDEAAALAHQAELEEDPQELLRADPAYAQWLAQIANEYLQVGACHAESE